MHTIDDSRIEIKIDEEHAGERIDSVLSLLMEDCSRSYLQKLIADGHVFVEGKACTSKKEKLKDGSVVAIDFPPLVSCEAKPENMDLDIVYEDDDLIVVNKPKGLVVHPAAGNLTGTLVNGLLAHCGALSTINGVERPGIVHRIDKDTSGLLVVAKSDAAHKGLSVQFAEHSITRLYKAISFFNFKDDEGCVDAPLGRDPKNRLRMAIVPGGKRAVTHFKVINRFKGYDEVLCRLETGRTHQIRVHLASLHHPIVGDCVYGPAKQPFKTQGQLLHAGVLGFVHPITGQYMEFSVEAPNEYKEIIERLSK